MLASAQAANRDHKTRGLDEGDGDAEYRGGENRRCHRADV
jgi:hypothetical protein